MNSLDIIERLTNGIRLIEYSNLEQVILIPQYHGIPINLISKFPKIHLYCYSSFYKNEASLGEPNQLITLSMKALSDKNRLKILRFIVEKERTFTDIQKYMNLARSTVHYHLVMLRSAGLITILSSPEDSDRFQFRPTGLENVHGKLIDYLKG
jgi:DNA-binding transcriptional ArsR family regulator